MKKCIIHIALCLFVSAAAGQEQHAVPDTSITLAPVKIETDNSGKGYKTVKMDSLLMKTSQGKTLADILQSSGTVYIKQYAPGQLSSISMRGSNAFQVQVLWNGFNLNNLSLGQTDFSLIPVSAFSGIEVNMGAMGATGGNGVVAGSVSIGNSNEVKAGQISVTGGIQAGSFGKYSANAAFNERGKKHAFFIKPFYFNARNQFPYLTPEGNKATMPHAGSKLYGTLAAFHWYASKHILRFETWMQASERNIPPTLFEEQSQATQQDKSLRFTLSHHRQSQGFLNVNRIGYFYDQLDYSNRLTALSSGFKVHNLVGETESYWARGWSRHTIKLFGSAALADNSSYENKGEKMLRASLGYFYENRLGQKQPVNIKLDLKEEVNNGVFSIPVVQLGSSTSFSKQFKRVMQVFTFNINAGTVYRFPTLNDLYWYPGGNPGLKPEKGGAANVSGEWNLVTLKQEKLNYLRIHFTHYQRYMYDWIMWMPNGANWSPQNLQEVWSRGNETALEIRFGNAFKTFSKILFNYTLSTIQGSTVPNDRSIGRQLIYTPMYNTNAQVGMLFKGLSVSGSLSYYGYRYTSSDNYEYLEPFYLLDARITYTRRLSIGLIDVFAEANNLLDKTYYWVAQRPALPRNFNAGVSFKWMSKQKAINTNTIK